jgi:hypothetical protein
LEEDQEMTADVPIPKVPGDEDLPEGFNENEIHIFK